MKKSKPSKKLTNVLGEGDLQAIGDLVGGLLDKQAAVLASKKDLEMVKTDLKLEIVELRNTMNEGFESIMAGVDAVAEKLAEKEKFDRLVAYVKEVGEKVGIKVNL